ncbi:hypothetical protein [Paramaledivibacter caminithermalis]|uniref:hypothetical protein n=1 Tax=Paramaledivibacter caminithermalis TaxID=191027 RepID=UPI0010422388|nr:hypothetical protein [Paramaledivibacter caminithermalis]
MTYCVVNMAILSKKLMIGAKGGRNFKVYLKEFQTRAKVLKRRLKCLKVQIAGIKQLRDRSH